MNWISTVGHQPFLKWAFIPSENLLKKAIFFLCEHLSIGNNVWVWDENLFSHPSPLSTGVHQAQTYEALRVLEQSMWAHMCIGSVVFGIPFLGVAMPIGYYNLPVYFFTEFPKP